ncbi:MAG TPA: aspartate--tRNA ligase [Candidatus Paceibacterota bacterium]
MNERIFVGNARDHMGEEISLAGWVDVCRDHGKLIFIDLRDMSGKVQVVFDSKNDEAYKTGSNLRPEWVVSLRGVVKERPANMINKDSALGYLEIEAREVKVISVAETLPFEVDKDTKGVNEETRLTYRYLDLRSERMKRNLKMRAEVIQYLRNYLHENNFLEIQTPILTKSTPEGARDYLVPSRKYHGKFFALPQSPQQYKQLLMVAGFERYFQIAPCFRDEDARADRSPGEFYQLDVEMSFVTQEDILDLVETMFTKMVQELFPEKRVTFTPWPRLKYSEVMEKYNSDKPDLRKDINSPDELAFAWIIDFPLFTPQTKEDFFHGAGDKYAPSHHMFTSPKEEDIHLLDTDPLKVKSYQHDLVLNGYEIGGGSIRIHDPKLQESIFNLIGFTDEQKKSFSHLLKAFTYGVPPHGGVAPGIDRLVALLVGERNIREVIAFPLTGEARDPLMDAPSEVSKKQLDELGIKIKKHV